MVHDPYTGYLVLKASNIGIHLDSTSYTVYSVCFVGMGTNSAGRRSMIPGLGWDGGLLGCLGGWLIE